MHKTEPKVNSTLITRANKVYELKVRTIGTIVVLDVKFNSEVDLTSHYRESTALQ